MPGILALEGGEGVTRNSRPSSALCIFQANYCPLLGLPVKSLTITASSSARTRSFTSVSHCVSGWSGIHCVV